MTPRTRKEKFLYRGSVERVLHCGSMDDYTDLLFGIEHHNRLLEQERRSSNTVEMVLCRGSMDDCADLLLGIEHHNDSYVVVAWGSSYIVEMQKGSCSVEAWTIVPIRC